MEDSNGASISRMLVGDGVLREGRSSAAMVVGLAFYWQLFRWANISNVVAGAEGASEGGLLPLAFYGSALVIALVLLSFKGLSARLFSPRLAFVTGAVGSAALSGAWVCRVVPEEGATVLVTASLVLSAGSFSVITLAWARRCRTEARLCAKRAVLLACLSSLASFVLTSMNSLVANDHALLAASAPVASALCLLLCEGSSGREGLGEQPPFPFAFGPVAAVMVSLLVLIVCMKGVSDSFYSTESDSMLYLKHFITVAELTAIVFACLFATDMGRFAFAGWVVLVGGVLSGLSLLLFPGEPSAAFQFGLGTVTSGRTCLELFAFILATCLSARDELRSILALLVVPETAGCLVGYGALPSALRSAGMADGEWFGILSLGACAITVASTLLAMSFLALKGLDGAPPPRPPAEALEAGSRRFGEFANRFSLTKREEETAYLFYRGYSTKRIAELHYVSLNTTQSHLRSVYRKTGVHSRQQLIDLVESAADAGGGPDEGGR
ncbi:hypothetical protein B5F40_10930 [Gordonibacter sp. An230]|uniref:helix-turn-helix transcriptional regulator n=1 Tax=Gordonibacter sp. An230 TaxID=1965592 RepID=UPI000B37B65C|nr:helix-turn-helix domain-containing protein [Gordonibacter sp. An230]OUO89395.1 hypothetical protein B5F40_10930 [Gordonibacter sp. An230]